MKKEDQPEKDAVVSQTDDALEPATEEQDQPEETNDTISKQAESEDGQEAEEEVPELKGTSRQRQPSISVQSKLRSSSFRQSSGGPISPSYAFSPEGDTAPDIHRKQAVRIEELEKENKRLAREASENEKRWKKAEEELEDLREVDDVSIPKRESSADKSSPAEVEKLVSTFLPTFRT